MRVSHLVPMVLVACAGCTAGAARQDGGGPAPPRVETEAARAVTFCAPQQGPAPRSAGEPIHFPDTLRIVRDTAWASVRIDTSAALASGHDWFRTSEPITLGGVRYFRGGGTLAARAATDGGTGHPWVRVTERDGVPFYAHRSDVSEPRMLFAPVGLPCLLMPYVHQDDVRVHPPR